MNDGWWYHSAAIMDYNVRLCSVLSFISYNGNISHVFLQSKLCTNHPRLKLACQYRKFQWFVPFSRYGVAFTYYGISLNITGFGLNPYLTQFIFASIEMPLKIGVYFFLEKVGRMPGEMGSLLLTGLCLFINIFVAKGYFEFFIAF